MRKIKFRVFIYEDNKIYYQDRYKEYENNLTSIDVVKKRIKITEYKNYENYYYGKNCFDEEEEKNKIMQYTGIEDSKGKEIYENDIVKILVESGYGDSYSQSEHICEVIYFGSGFYLKPINLSLSDETIISIEVIGNIYEKNKRIDLK